MIDSLSLTETTIIAYISSSCYAPSVHHDSGQKMILAKKRGNSFWLFGSIIKVSIVYEVFQDGVLPSPSISNQGELLWFPSDPYHQISKPRNSFYEFFLRFATSMHLSTACVIPLVPLTPTMLGKIMSFCLNAFHPCPKCEFLHSAAFKYNELHCTPCLEM